MRGTPGLADDAGRYRVGGPENLSVDPVGRGTSRGQRGGNVLHELDRAAEVAVRSGGDAGRAEHLSGEVAGNVEVVILRPGLAVADDVVGVGQLGEQGADFRRERVLGAVPGAVQPPHLSRRPRR